MVKGASAPGIPGQRTLHFWKGFQCSGCSHALVLWLCGGRNFCSRCYLRSKFSPLCMFQVHDLGFCSVVSEKPLSISLLIWPVGADPEMEQDPMVFAPPCPQLAFCLWQNFSQKISLTREVRRHRSKEKQSSRIKQ